MSTTSCSTSGDVSYIDSGGLGELVSNFTTVKRAEGHLGAFNLGKQSKDLLATTKLPMVFDTFDTEQEGLESFGPSQSEPFKMFATIPWRAPRSVSQRRFAAAARWPAARTSRLRLGDSSRQPPPIHVSP